MTLAIRYYYGYSPEGMCAFFFLVLVWGMFSRGVLNCTNVLLLTTSVLWYIEAAASEPEWYLGYWPIALYGVSFVTMFVWACVQVDHEID